MTACEREKMSARNIYGSLELKWDCPESNAINATSRNKILKWPQWMLHFFFSIHNVDLDIRKKKDTVCVTLETCKMLMIEKHVTCFINFLASKW